MGDDLFHDPFDDRFGPYTGAGKRLFQKMRRDLVDRRMGDPRYHSKNMEGMWMVFFEYLEVPDWCRLGAVSKWHQALAEKQFQNYARSLYPYIHPFGSGNAVKVRVCQFFRASKFVAHRIRHDCFFQEEEDEEDPFTADVSYRGCCDLNVFDPSNLVAGMMEYFVCIARHRRTTEPDEPTGSSSLIVRQALMRQQLRGEQEDLLGLDIVFQGFLPAMCESLSLHPFNQLINDRWLPLLEWHDLRSCSKKTVLSADGVVEFEAKCSSISRLYSIYVVGMEIPTWSCMSGRIHRIVEITPKTRHHLFIHVDDSLIHPYSGSYLYDQKQQQQITASLSNQDMVCVHIWIELDDHFSDMDNHVKARFREMRLGAHCLPTTGER